MLKPNTPVLNVLGVVCLCTMSALSSSALAQVADNSEPVTLPTVVVSVPRPTPSADVAGYGDTPLARLPAAVTVINESALAASGARRLADVMKQDSAVSDAYNVVGYWDFATVRGFVLNNSYNYRRDGLPISAETFIALDNKSQVDVFKGTSGVQSGVAAPGGMMNYAVKRPPVREPIAAARLETTSTGAALAALDLGARFGIDKAFGYRLNLAGERLRDAAPGTRGERTLAALALDWRATPDSVFAVEVEQSRRSQPTVPALSLLGNTLSAPDPRLNVNTQAWSAPVQLAGLTGSVKFEQALSDTWRWSAHANRQALASNDRVAYGYGCSAGQTPVYDRYCANGDIDLYDYRSDGERRAQSGAALTLRGTPSWGGVAHQFVAVL